MSMIIPVLQSGATGAEEEAKSVIGTLVAQILTLVRNVISWLMNYMGKVLSWAGEHPLATLLLVTNMAIWLG